MQIVKHDWRRFLEVSVGAEESAPFTGSLLLVEGGTNILEWPRNSRSVEACGQRGRSGHGIKLKSLIGVAPLSFQLNMMASVRTCMWFEDVCLHALSGRLMRRHPVGPIGSLYWP